MVDDLPHAGDPEQRRRLTELLVQLARSSRFPIAVIVTGSHAQGGGSFGGAGKAGSFQGWHRVRRSCPLLVCSPNCGIAICSRRAASWIADKACRHRHCTGVSSFLTYRMLSQILDNASSV